ncbi:hypothetical protein JAAARDRAFT_209603 [Jaapia argillacea MUCL 33604]|uniref:F-box domain-containing protein n=1 Tax=Jaapia argillacea MUCL 33604 TaxID=933084 RepID=A0A067PJZ9_9AGAM|nr:hypothetical protein JAAARDRAFT_209603 [Jaapia argillacea MUCL 33604]
MVSTVHELPSELLEQIFGLLDVRSILKCQSVSTFFRDLIQKSLLLQYTIELGVAGYTNNSASPSSIEKRLQMLEQHQAQWTAPVLECSNTIRLPNQDPDGGMRHFENGMLVDMYDATNTGKWGFDTLTMYNLTSVAEVPSSSTIRTQFEFSSSSAMDPLQDLMIFVLVPAQPRPSYFELSIASLRDGNPHPRATSQSIRVGSADINMDMPLCTGVQIAGDLLLLSVYTQKYAHKLELFVLDWTTGLVRGKIQQPGNRILNHFLLVSDSCLLVCCLERQRRLPIVDVYRLDNSPSIQPGSQKLATIVRTFELPAPNSDHITRMRFATDTARTYPPSECEKSSGLPFSMPSNNRLISLTLRISENSTDHTQHLFDIFTPLGTFLHSHKISEESTVVRWKDWGPSSTRWFRRLQQSPSHQMHGYRVIALNRIWDFNPLDVARDMHRSNMRSTSDDATLNANSQSTAEVWPTTKPGQRSWIRAEPTTIKAGGIFQDDIISTLPYRETWFEKPLNVEGVWLSDRVIGYSLDDQNFYADVYQGLCCVPRCAE